METLKRFSAAGLPSPHLSIRHRNRSVAAAVVAMCLLAACSSAAPTSERQSPVDSDTFATVVVRQADGTPANGAEVALAETGDGTQVAPVRGRTDAEGRVVLHCVSACQVEAWTRDPPAVWQERSI